MKIQYAILFVGDMDASVAFWRDTVGMTLRFATPEWTEFETEGATVALHAARAPAREGDEKRAGTARFGFQVDDLERFHARMVGHAVHCLQPPTPLHGTRLAEYAGPDGLVFTVGEARGS